MLSLCLGILSSALVSVIMRLSGGRIKNNLGMLAMNYIVCSVLAALFCDAGQTLAFRNPDWGTALFMGGINGVMYLAGFILMQINIPRNGVVLSSIFQKLGLLVPIVISVCFYREMPSFLQGMGFLLAVAAIVLMNYRKDDAGAGFKLGLLGMLLACGMAEAMSKIFKENGAEELEPQFLLFTFVSAMTLCLLCMIAKKQRIGFSELLFGSLIAIPNFFSSKFLLGALESVPAVIVFPVFSVGTILTLTLTGVLLFRERITKQQWIAISIILVALVLLNI